MHKKVDARSGQFEKRTQRGSASGGKFTLGAPGIAKLNSIEGIEQSAASRAMFVQFERSGLSPDERRKAIIAKHKG